MLDLNHANQGVYASRSMSGVCHLWFIAELRELG